MNAIQLLRNQLEDANNTLESTMADVTQEVADFDKTKKAMPVGAAYAHAVLAQDMIVSDLLAHTPKLAKDFSKIGLSQPMPSQEEWDKNEKWFKTVKVDLSIFRKFAKKVYKKTDEYIASLKEKDLEREIELPGMGKRTVGFLLSSWIILHTGHLTGEISSIKGVQGKKGYPF